MKKEEIIKCLHEVTQINVTEKGVEWKLLYEDAADEILKLASKPYVYGESPLSKEKIDDLSLMLANHDFDSNLGRVIMPLMVCKKIVQMVAENIGNV